MQLYITEVNMHFQYIMPVISYIFKTFLFLNKMKR